MSDKLNINPPEATHIDSGPSINKWIRVTDTLHDYWCEAAERWITFEAGLGLNRHNAIRKHWLPIETNT